MSMRMLHVDFEGPWPYSPADLALRLRDEAGLYLVLDGAGEDARVLLVGESGNLREELTDSELRDSFGPEWNTERWVAVSYTPALTAAGRDYMRAHLARVAASAQFIVG